jgi:hypothetical protein
VLPVGVVLDNVVVGNLNHNCRVLGVYLCLGCLPD